MTVQRRAQRRKHHIIYKTTCTITGKWHIGLHSTDDLEDGYMGSGTHLWRSIKKHGKHNHKVEILEHCTDRATLIKREAEIVTEDLVAQEKCMNLMIGGNANPEERKLMEPTALEKIGAASLRMWDRRRAEGYVPPPQSPESVAKRAAANTGKKRTAEQISNLKEGQARYYASADPCHLQVRAQKSATTRQQRGTNKGGRPKGIPMSETEKLRLGERMRGNSPLSRRGMCAGCGKETTLVALNRWHASCRTPHA